MNLLPNTAWQINSGLLLVGKHNHQGTALMPAINVASTTIGANQVTALTANTGQLKAGDLVRFEPPAHEYLRICAFRVDEFISNTLFTGRLPLGLTAPTSMPCSATPVTVGDLTGNTGAGPDGWSKTPEVLGWIDDHPENLPVGFTRAFAIKKTIDGPQYFFYPVPAMELPKYLGRTFSFGLQVHHKIKTGTGTWRPLINTGAVTYGAAATTQAYQDIGLSGAVPSNAAFLDFGVVLDGKADDVYYIVGARANPGPTLEAWWPRPGYLIPRVMMLLATWFNANVNLNTPLSGGGFGFRFMPYPESNGRIAPDVRVLNMTWEGRNASSNVAFALRSAEAAPVVYSFVRYSDPVNAMICSSHLATMDEFSDAFFYSPTQGANLYNMSMEVNGFIL